jgi:amidase
MAPANYTLDEITIAELHAAYLSGLVSCREVTAQYLRRIEIYDRMGPALNSIITVSPIALAEADERDAAFRLRGLVGPLHGVPVLVKDQIDTVGMPTTMGSKLFRDYFPDRDATVVQRLRAAGAVVLAKTTLGELGAGDTHGTLFGSTRNPYDLERTVGGSSGGSAAAVAANLGAVALGQEGLASIRRPAAWNCTVGMRPSLGLVSRSGAFGGWPSKNGSLGPMTRTVEDTARLLDAIVGYDPDDPSTAWGIGRLPGSFVSQLDRDGLRGVRVGVIRESIGLQSEPGSDDYQRVAGVFDKAVVELAAAGADVVDPVVIPHLHELLAKRATEHAAESFETWMGRSAAPPYRTYAELTAEPLFTEVAGRRTGGRPPAWNGTPLEYAAAREQLNTNMLVVMAELELDAFVHVTVEHSPTLIRDGVNPPYVNGKGAPHLNTFLYDVPAISVPAGFTSEDLPVGITFLGRPISDAAMVRYAYAYEQATQHRRPPATAPPLSGRP